MDVLASIYRSTMSILNGSDPEEEILSQFSEGSILQKEPSLSPVRLSPSLSPGVSGKASPVHHWCPGVHKGIHL